MSWWSLQHNVQVNLAVMWICCRSDMIVATYASMSMRLPSTLLKAAACLLLGASFLAGTKASALTTFDWTSLVNGNPGAGQFAIAEDIGNLNPGVGYLITSISGTFNGITIGALSQPGTYLGNNNLYYYNTTNDFAVDGNGVSFNDINSQAIEYNIYGAGPNTPADRFGTSDTSVSGSSFTSSASVASAVPAPLPILGLPAVFFYSRKLRKRIKVSKEASGASLV